MGSSEFDNGRRVAGNDGAGREREGRERPFPRERTDHGADRVEELQSRLSGLSSASKAFTAAIRATQAERQRMAEERDLLLAREKTARAEAEAARELVTRVLESITDAFYALDREWCFTYVNRKAEQLLGKPREELLGKTIWERSPRPEGSEPYQEIKQAVEEGITTEFEALVPASGAWISGRAYPSPEGVSVYFQDISNRKRAEEERERSLARELELRAQAGERRRISRELHDRVAHTIAVVHQSLELHEALKERDPAAAEAKMELASKMAKEALASTRNLSMELRRPEVRRGLEAALADLLHNAVPPTVHSEIYVEGDETSIPPHARNQLFVILREAVRNTIAHSGCDRIAVELDITADRVVGSVEDNGQGFDPDEARSAGGGGLRSMEERAALMDGTLGVSSTSSGTRVKASVPLKGS